MNGCCPRCGALITAVVHPYGFLIMALLCGSALVGALAMLLAMVLLRVR